MRHDCSLLEQGACVLLDSVRLDQSSLEQGATAPLALLYLGPSMPFQIDTERELEKEREGEDRLVSWWARWRRQYALGKLIEVVEKRLTWVVDEE